MDTNRKRQNKEKIMNYGERVEKREARVTIRKVKVSHSLMYDSLQAHGLSMGFSRQECWNGLLFPSPGDLPDPGIKPRSPALQADSLLSELPGKPSRRLGFNPWKRELLPTPVLLPAKFHGQRSLVGYGPWGCKGLDMTW